MQPTFLAAWSKAGAPFVPALKPLNTFASHTTNCEHSGSKPSPAFVLAPNRNWRTTQSGGVKDSASWSPRKRGKNEKKGGPRKTPLAGAPKQTGKKRFPFAPPASTSRRRVSIV